MSGDEAAAAAAAAAAADETAAGEADAALPEVHVTFGSETGTAHDLALTVADRLRARGVRVRHCMALDAFPVQCLVAGRHVLLCLCATTGDGEAPGNMQRFWRFLRRKDLSPFVLRETTQAAVFGLGDSSYDKYNAVARRLWVRLVQQLGAQPVVPLALGDDQAELGLYSAFEPWMTGLLQALQETYPGLFEEQAAREWVQFARRDALYHVSSRTDCAITISSSSNHDSNSNSNGDSKRVSESDDNMKEEEDDDLEQPCRHAIPSPLLRNADCLAGPLTMSVTANERMTPSEWYQAVHHIEFTLCNVASGEDIPYAPGDVAIVIPRNNDAPARAMLQRTRLDPHTVLEIQRLGSDQLAQQTLPFDAWGVEPWTCTAYDLFARYLDIEGVPTRVFFARLAEFATDTEEQSKLTEIAGAEGMDLFLDYCIREKRKFWEVFCEFVSCDVPLARLLELIPPARPRQFSIASAPTESPKALQLCVAVVQTRTPYGRQHSGVCSSWLAALRPGERVHVWIKRGGLRASAQPNARAQLLISTGTGIAPMRSVIRDTWLRSDGHSHSDSNKSDGKDDQRPQILAFVGHRRQAMDYLYAHEWEAIAAADTSLALECIPAFSRDVPDGTPKVYVMHKLREHADVVRSMVLDENCTIFIAGSSTRMPSDVKRALAAILTTSEDPEDLSDGFKILRVLENKKRLVMECWG